MKELGIGVVGCGFVGRGAHVPSFANIEGAQLVAAADADEKRRNKAATEHKVESRTRTTKQKLTTRKSYGFRTYEAVETALYHNLGALPELEFTRRFFVRRRDSGDEVRFA